MPLLVASVLAMTAAQLLDLATFMEMMGRVGPAAEANPLVVALFGAYGLPMVAVAKIALLALLSGIVAVLERQRIRLALPIIGLILTAAIAAGIVGGATNTAAVRLL